MVLNLMSGLSYLRKVKKRKIARMKQAPVMR